MPTQVHTHTSVVNHVANYTTSLNQPCLTATHLDLKSKMSMSTIGENAQSA